MRLGRNDLGQVRVIQDDGLRATAVDLAGFAGPGFEYGVEIGDAIGIPPGEGIEQAALRLKEPDALFVPFHEQRQGLGGEIIGQKAGSPGDIRKLLLHRLYSLDKILALLGGLRLPDAAPLHVDGLFQGTAFACRLANTVLHLTASISLPFHQRFFAGLYRGAFPLARGQWAQGEYVQWLVISGLDLNPALSLDSDGNCPESAAQRQFERNLQLFSQSHAELSQDAREKPGRDIRRVVAFKSYRRRSIRLNVNFR